MKTARITHTNQRRAIVKDLPASRTTPLILVGDFNNNPYLDRATNREPEIQALLSELQDLAPDDVATRIRVANNKTRPVRIDRMFGNRRVEGVETHLDEDAFDPDTQMFMQNGLGLSDHRPVVATVDVPGR